VKVLYLSFDGILEPIGRSQVYEYLRLLARDHEITLITFEKSEDLSRAGREGELRRACRAAGIDWRPLRYFRGPGRLGPVLNILRALVHGFSHGLRRRPGLIHARSYPSAFVAMLLAPVLRARFLFDMRGFWADERVDDGFWRKGSLKYRLAKRFEAAFLTRCDAAVSLTQAAVDELHAFPFLRGRAPLFEVIPTCVNLDRFRILDAPRPPELVIGCVGTIHRYLFDEMLRFFVILRGLRPDARLAIFNMDARDVVRGRAVAAGLPETAFDLRSVPQDYMARELNGLSAGLFFNKPSVSKKAASPTKVGELLACGVPCVTNDGMGDFPAVIKGERAGVVVEGFTDAELRAGAERLLALIKEPGARERCAEAALKHYDLRKGAAAYDRLYKALGR
jgi:glycosyltransferase involved in cell wall biosynthesis